MKFQSIIPVILVIKLLFPGVVCSQETSGLQWYSMEEAQRLAKEDGRNIWVYAEASWCTYCRKMEKEVFPDERVAAVMQKYVLPVKVNVKSDQSLFFNKKRMTEAQFAEQHQLLTTPSLLFMDSDGSVIATYSGFLPAEMLARLTEYIAKEEYTSTSFEEFLNTGKKSD